ncbi:MAG: EAL domain-containing protein [Proteobacteria bacterium]|nr:EAL domain-containing protein [Pseudomonadota bacterium]
MAWDTDTKRQRDKFLAFAFASSDLFIEVTPDEKVSYALGAALGVTGIDKSKLEGTSWLDLFAPGDQTILRSMRRKAQEGVRCGPILVAINEKIAANKKAVVTGIRMPGENGFFLTLGFSSVLMNKIGAMAREEDITVLQDKETFLQSAEKALGMAKGMGQEAKMTMLDIAAPEAGRRRMGDEAWDGFLESLAGLLRSKSIDGSTAGQIGEGRYSIVHDGSVDAEALKEEVQRLSKKSDPAGRGVEIESKTIESGEADLSEHEMAKALVYTINSFGQHGVGMSVKSFAEGFKTYVTDNAQKIKTFKTMVKKLDFQLHFQPVVDLDMFEASHFEMLTRFPDGGSPYEWISFGEDMGMAADFDMAVCERAINYLAYSGSSHNKRFAINLSGQSIQSEAFFKALYTKLSAHKSLSKNLMFEITESTTIKNLDMVNEFIKILQDDGFEICMDDFGAGSASFQYLHKLHVDYVKLDGQYTRKILTDERDAAMVKNMAQMCNDLGVKVVAEMIEEERQVIKLAAMGIQYGQGYYFSKPVAMPEYKSDLGKRSRVRTSRRIIKQEKS